MRILELPYTNFFPQAKTYAIEKWLRFGYKLTEDVEYSFNGLMKYGPIDPCVWRILCALYIKDNLH